MVLMSSVPLSHLQPAEEVQQAQVEHVLAEVELHYWAVARLGPQSCPACQRQVQLQEALTGPQLVLMAAHLEPCTPMQPCREASSY